MSIERYRALIEQLAAWYSVDEVAGSSQVVHLNVDGASFSLYYGGVLAPDSMLVHCEFGDLPQPRPGHILQRLLEMNTYLFSIRHSAFSYDVANDRIILICQFDLGQLSRSMLMEAFEDVARMADQWRRDYFLVSSQEPPVRKQ